MTSAPIPRRRLSPVQFGVLVASVIGAIAGILTLYVHLVLDPLADVQAYWLAGQRLNEGEPLYPLDADTRAADFYRYPPLLAILFRPLALLPFEVAAAIWGVAMVAAFVATLWIIGIRAARTWAAVCVLAAPIAWTLAIGQAESLITLLVAIAAPWSVAVAANVKLFPALVALWWIGTRRWDALGHFVVWLTAIALLQLVLEPANSIAFLRQTGLQLVGHVNNLSPYVASPLLWAALLGLGVIAAVHLAPSRWGWPLVVTVSVLATPRLLLYVLSTLLAALADPHRGLPSEGGLSTTGRLAGRWRRRAATDPVD